MGGRSGRRILITGGTGFLGRRVTQAALGRGDAAFVLTRRPDSEEARRLALGGARLLLGDVTNRESLRAAFEVARPHDVVHNAGMQALRIGRALRRAMRAVNVEGVETALSLAVEAGAERIVYVSSTIALGHTGKRIADETFEREAPAASWYEATRAEALAVARRHQRAGEPIVVALPAHVVGPGDPSFFGVLARRFVRGRSLPVLWGPDGVSTFVHVDDVGQGILACASVGVPGETYLLAADFVTTRELMAIWRSVVGRVPVRLWLPRSLAVAAATIVSPWSGLSPEVVRMGFGAFRYASPKASVGLGVSFRSAARAWEETLRAEPGFNPGGRRAARR